MEKGWEIHAELNGLPELRRHNCEYREIKEARVGRTIKKERAT